MAGLALLIVWVSVTNALLLTRKIGAGPHHTTFRSQKSDTLSRVYNDGGSTARLGNSLSTEAELTEFRTRTSSRPINSRGGEYDFEMWAKAFATQADEFDYTLTAEEMEGTLPSDFSGGSLFRNMPALFERAMVWTMVIILTVMAMWSSCP